MAVDFTGSPQYVVDVGHTTSGSETVTIPNDCTAVIVCAWGWVDGSAVEFTALNWDGAGLDFDSIVSLSVSDNDWDVFSYIMTTADETNWPDTGSKTLNWTFSVDTSGYGGTVVIIFFKGLDVDDPIRSSESVGGPANGDWTFTLADVDGDDLTILCAAIDSGSSFEGRGGDQVVLVSDVNDNNADWEINSESGEGAPSIQSDDDYAGMIAFALKVAAGGAVTNAGSITPSGEFTRHFAGNRLLEGAL